MGRSVKRDCDRLIAAANQRFEDARCLCEPRNRRYVGAVYLLGIVLDCLLKARLLRKHPHLAIASADGLRGRDRELWALVYRRHELPRMIEEMPEVLVELQGADHPGSNRLPTLLRQLCTKWEIAFRYRSDQLDAQDALRFLESVKELKPWLA